MSVIQLPRNVQFMYEEHLAMTHPTADTRTDHGGAAPGERAVAIPWPTRRWPNDAEVIGEVKWAARTF